ncbi:hypothetical protein [Aquimarina sediminis]|uniref:hypothetical protein n=1 Tax=Aquimarina sediminis TaxID=2070536 RepID=UPI000CA07BAC|nr:hypothetical protein [Aquimarina sediminis]
MINVFKLLNIGSIICAIGLLIDCILNNANSILVIEDLITDQNSEEIETLRINSIYPVYTSNKKLKLDEINLTAPNIVCSGEIQTLITSEESDFDKCNVFQDTVIKLSHIDRKITVQTNGNKNRSKRYDESTSKKKIAIPIRQKITKTKIKKNTSHPSLSSVNI